MAAVARAFFVDLLFLVQPMSTDSVRGSGSRSNVGY
jgi:hypothetical protein